MPQTEKRTTRFDATVRFDLDVCGRRASVAGSFAFRRWVLDEEELATQRALVRASLALIADDGAQYQAVGTADVDPAEAPSGDDEFDMVYRAVLVGAGTLNNHLLTLAMRVVEHPDGTAKADVVKVDVECS